METVFNTSVGGSVPELVITRIFDAPPELVFKAWTEPERLRRWWGPHGFTVPVCELDLRPGGAMHLHMRGPDGQVIPVQGVFHEVVPPVRLVFSTKAFEDAVGEPQLVVLHIVTFADLDGKTRLTLQARVIKSTPEVAEALAGMEQGWREGLERLAESLR